MTVYISEYRCFHNHVILAEAWEHPAMTRTEAEAHLKRMVDLAVGIRFLNPWCGLCLSKKFHFHTWKTQYATLEEAAPFLQRTEAENIRTMLAAEKTKGRA